MPSTPPLLLHIGYHKTATTWMQRSLFRPDHGYRQIGGHDEVFEFLVRPHDLDFDAAAARAALRPGLDRLGPGEVPVLSSEILSGLPFDGARESASYAARLKAAFPEARILISIRSQRAILASVYMQYVRRGGTMSPKRFFHHDPGLGYFGFDPAHFEYDRLLGRYQALFGAGNVHVLTQESLRPDPEPALRALARFCDNALYAGLAPDASGAEGASDPEYAVPLLRRVNYLRAGPINRNPAMPLGALGDLLFRGTGYLARRAPVKRLLGGKRPVSAEVRRDFGGRYAESNRRLAALLGPETDLTGYEGIAAAG